MKKSIHLFAGGLAALTLIVSLSAAEPPAAAPAADATPGLDAAAGLDDSAFDRYVDLGAAGRAWRARDAAALTDAALQLAEGERVLLRTHKSGMTAAGLLGLATRLAADGKDKATLDRLARAADAGGDKALAGRVAAARKLAEASRAADPALLLPVETTTPEEFAAFGSALGEIRSARLAGDAAKLRAIEQELPDVPGLAPERRDYLKGLLKEAHDSMPAADPDTAKLGRTLDKLAAADRGWGISDLDPFNKNSGINKTAAQVDQQRIHAMEGVAGGRYTVTLRNPTRRPINYAINGQEQIAILAGRAVRLSGLGTATISFDAGTNDGSRFTFDLPGGNTYHFEWRHDGFSESGPIDQLHLFKD